MPKTHTSGLGRVENQLLFAEERKTSVVSVAGFCKLRHEAKLGKKEKEWFSRWLDSPVRVRCENGPGQTAGH